MMRIENKPDEPAGGIMLRLGTIEELVDAVCRLAGALGAEPESVIGPLADILDRRAAFEWLKARGLRVPDQET